MTSDAADELMVRVLPREQAMTGPGPSDAEKDETRFVFVRGNDSFTVYSIDLANGKTVGRYTIMPPKARKTHCIHGHEFTPENTDVRNGKRACKTCRRRNEKRRRANERANK